MVQEFVHPPYLSTRGYESWVLSSPQLAKSVVIAAQTAHSRSGRGVCTYPLPYAPWIHSPRLVVHLSKRYIPQLKWIRSTPRGYLHLLRQHLHCFFFFSTSGRCSFARHPTQHFCPTEHHFESCSCVSYIGDPQTWSLPFWFSKYPQENPSKKDTPPSNPFITRPNTFP